MTICDICEQKIEKPIAPCVSLLYRSDTKFEFIRDTLDICNTCVNKLSSIRYKDTFKKVING